MTIRKATRRETQQIVGHSLYVLKEASMGHIPPKQEKALQMVTPFLADGGYYLVYKKGNDIQGWIGVGRTTDYYTDKLVGMIPELYVLPQYRNRGIAEKLCNEALKSLREAGFSSVQLNVFAGNAIKSFYQKLGFKDVTTLMEMDLNQD